MANNRLIDSLGYKPVELGFGTSGLRGLVSDMTDLECYINTAGFLTFLKDTGQLKVGQAVYLGGDLRDSTPRISRAVGQAIRDQGQKIVYCGLIPTPALALFAQKYRRACVMVTGSHIPADRNGIKFYKPDGEVMKSDEEPIGRAVASMRGLVYTKNMSLSIFDESGSIKNARRLPLPNRSAITYYEKRYKQIKNRPLTGRHIIVYQHSAVGRDNLTEILTSLGAKVTAVGRSSTFVPLDTENVTHEDKAYFSKLSKAYPDCFAIVSTDGDSDRPLVVDEQGVFYCGDVLGCLIAAELGATFAAIPISSNDAVDTYLKSRGIQYTHTRIGSPYVIEAMRRSKVKIRVGWEVNGGFLLGSNVEFQGAWFEALPTRDAILPIVIAIIAASSKNQKLSAYFGQLPRRYTSSALLDISQLAANAFRAMPPQEASSLITKQIKDDSLGKVKTINTTDGIRISFASGDVIHIRSSGNAPQLRIYTNSDTQKRADDLAASAVRSGGLLERVISRL